MTSIDPDPLLDLLNVRFLEQSESCSASFILLDYSMDARRDAFVRAAAAEAFLTQCKDSELRGTYRDSVEKARGERDGKAALLRGLSRLPDNADVVAGVHSAALGTSSEMLKAWRSLSIAKLSEACLSSGGGVSPAQLALQQRQMDMPGQLPCEIAVRFGNWRVDYALFALRWVDGSNRWWIHLGGIFQPAKIARGLGVDDAGTQRGSELRLEVGGWTVRAAAETLEVWEGSFDVSGRGSGLADFHEHASQGTAPIWAVIKARCETAALLGLGDAAFRVEIDPANARGIAVAHYAGDEHATYAAEQWSNWKAAQMREVEEQIGAPKSRRWLEVSHAPAGAMESGKDALAWRSTLEGVDVTTRGCAVTWEAQLPENACDETVRLLCTAIARSAWLRIR
ncbi:MAG: hypothetical protein KDC98_23240 [Planctomycetes bacterium]|nr:hypothetical protein [Planctomycetota bacterium]